MSENKQIDKELLDRLNLLLTLQEKKPKLSEEEISTSTALILQLMQEIQKNPLVYRIDLENLRSAAAIANNIVEVNDKQIIPDYVACRSFNETFSTSDWRSHGYPLKVRIAGAKKIGENAFHLSNITAITIPKEIEEIGNSCFCYCGELREAVFEEPSRLKVIPEQSFECTMLRTVKIPMGVTKIMWKAFAKCDELSEVILPDSLEYIGEFAFYTCPKLKKFRLPKSLKYSRGIICSTPPEIIEVDLSPNGQSLKAIVEEAQAYLDGRRQNITLKIIISEDYEPQVNDLIEQAKLLFKEVNFEDTRKKAEERKK